MESGPLRCSGCRIFASKCLFVRDAKGEKWRRTLFAFFAVALATQIDSGPGRYISADIQGRLGRLSARCMAKKYPKAPHTSPQWQLFSRARTGRLIRAPDWFFVTMLGSSRCVALWAAALSKLAIHKKASCHTFRHSFATNLSNRNGCRSIQELLRHNDVNTNNESIPMWSCPTLAEVSESWTGC